MADLTRRDILIGIPLAAALAASKGAKAANSKLPSELWELTMTLDVPRIYDNMSSRGYRKYQKQRVKGTFGVFYAKNDEPEIRFYELYNKTHKIGGRHVEYNVDVGESVLWHGIGSNKTCKFNTRSVRFDIEAMPSYAIGPAPTEDNSLLVTLSGRGYSNGKRLRGSVAGQIGCGCAEYGHVSPTRIWNQCRVIDTAAVFGTWSAKLVS